MLKFCRDRFVVPIHSPSCVGFWDHLDVERLRPRISRYFPISQYVSDLLEVPGTESLTLYCGLGPTSMKDSPAESQCTNSSNLAAYPSDYYSSHRCGLRECKERPTGHCCSTE